MLSHHQPGYRSVQYRQVLYRTDSGGVTVPDSPEVNNTLLYTAPGKPAGHPFHCWSRIGTPARRRRITAGLDTAFGYHAIHQLSPLKTTRFRQKVQKVEKAEESRKLRKWRRRRKRRLLDPVEPANRVDSYAR